MFVAVGDLSVVAVDWFVGEKPLQPDTASIRHSNPTATGLA
jgi:hypothetical protein